MLPDLRALIAATIATIGLLMIAFGAVAALRVAQGSHGVLRADLANRARMAELPPPARRPPTVIDTPGPHIAPFPPLPSTEIKDAPVATELHDLPASSAEAPSPATPAPVAALPPPEPPIGGPLAEPKPAGEAARAAARAEHARKLAAAKKARVARIARQRKAAARRAAQARAKQQQQPQQSAASFNNVFGNSSFNYGSGHQ
jgi:type IV secretory pathway VirB10-like protein